MKTPYRKLVPLAWTITIIAGCADPATVAPPIDENPKPLVVAIQDQHITEAIAEGEWLTSSPMDYRAKLIIDSENNYSTIVVDTVHEHILGLRIRLRLQQPRDSISVPLRSITIELDTSKKINLNSDGILLQRGEARLVFAIKDGTKVFYDGIAVDPHSDRTVHDKRDQVYTRIRAWVSYSRSGNKLLVLSMKLQHYFYPISNLRSIHHMRAELLCRIPLS